MSWGQAVMEIWRTWGFPTFWVAFSYQPNYLSLPTFGFNRICCDVTVEEMFKICQLFQLGTAATWLWLYQFTWTCAYIGCFLTTNALSILLHEWLNVEHVVVYLCLFLHLLQVPCCVRVHADVTRLGNIYPSRLTTFRACAACSGGLPQQWCVCVGVFTRCGPATAFGSSFSFSITGRLRRTVPRRDAWRPSLCLPLGRVCQPCLEWPGWQWTRLWGGCR